MASEEKKYLDLETTSDISDVFLLIKKAAWPEAKKTEIINLINAAKQNISLNGNNLELTGQTTPVNLSKYQQVLNLIQNTLSISDGNSISLRDILPFDYITNVDATRLDASQLTIKAFRIRIQSNNISHPQNNYDIADIYWDPNISVTGFTDGWYFIFIDYLGNIKMDNNVEGTNLGLEDQNQFRLIVTLKIESSKIIERSVNSVTSFSKGMMKVMHIEPSGRGGGDTNANAWVKSTLNTLKFSNLPNSELNTSSQLILPAGTYSVFFEKSIYNIDCLVRLYDITHHDELMTTLGNEDSNQARGTFLATEGTFELLENSTLELQVYSKNSQTDGMGRPLSISGRDERFSMILIYKID